jgi:hypothetical protein
MSDNTCAAASAPLEGDCVIVAMSFMPEKHISKIVKMLRQHVKVVLVSSTLRERYRPEVVAQLKADDIYYDLLIMRPENFATQQDINLKQYGEVVSLGLNPIAVITGV